MSKIITCVAADRVALHRQALFEIAKTICLKVHDLAVAHEQRDDSRVLPFIHEALERRVEDVESRRIKTSSLRGGRRQLRLQRHCREQHATKKELFHIDANSNRPVRRRLGKKDGNRQYPAR